jgi:hypothetical protein
MKPELIVDNNHHVARKDMCVEFSVFSDHAWRHVLLVGNASHSQQSEAGLSQ